MTPWQSPRRRIPVPHANGERHATTITANPNNPYTANPDITRHQSKDFRTRTAVHGIGAKRAVGAWAGGSVPVDSSRKLFVRCRHADQAAGRIPPMAPILRPTASRSGVWRSGALQGGFIGV